MPDAGRYLPRSRPCYAWSLVSDSKLPKSPVISDPDILGGTPVFAGTRVPIRVVFENLADGVALDDILDAYPTLSRDDVVEVIRQADRLVERAAS